MNKPKIDIERIIICESYHKVIRNMQDLLRLIEYQKIPEHGVSKAHAVLSEMYGDLDRRTAMRAEMLVLMWLYAPELLTEKRRSKKMRVISETMGLKQNNAYAYRKSLLFSYKTYAEFRKRVDEGIDAVFASL